MWIAVFVALFLVYGKRNQFFLSMGATTYLLLIRHGENEYVTTHRLAGRTPGVHLNDKGRQQAAALVNYLAGQPINVIYSSPLERCMETAEPLAQARGMTAAVETGLLEVDYGGWQGGDLRELSKQPEWSQVQHYPSIFRFPEGETLREVQARAVSAIERLRSAHPDQIVAVFSHGDVIRTSLAHYLGVPLDLFQRLAISTASVSMLAFFDGRPMVLGVNYVAELPRVEIKKLDPAEQKAEADAASDHPPADQPAADQGAAGALAGDPVTAPSTANVQNGQ
jgi:probable phosphomutase (TIGR03848 family)